MIQSPPDVHDCGCGGGVHLACSRSIGAWHAAKIQAEIQADEMSHDCEQFNELWKSTISIDDWEFLFESGFLNTDEIAKAAMRFKGW